MECDAGSALHDAGWSGNRKIEGTLDSSSDRLGAAYCVSSLKISDEKSVDWWSAARTCNPNSTTGQRYLFLKEISYVRPRSTDDLHCGIFEQR